MAKTNISSNTDLVIVFVLAEIKINNNNMATTINTISIINDSRLNYQFEICRIFCNLHLIINRYVFAI